MPTAAAETSSPNHFGLDFWKYFTGQLVSTLGTAFSLFALPLLIFKITGSAVNLGLATASGMLPYLLFGLPIGAWVDRVNRKRLMIVCNLALAVVMSSIAVLAYAGSLHVWYIYLCVFVSGTLGIAFNAAEFAAIPSLVGKDDLVTANGRIQASFSTAMLIGPILAGFLVSEVAIQSLLLVDAASFVIAALTLLVVRRSFNVNGPPKSKHIGQDIKDGLSYVLRNPVLRNISIMMALVNFVNTTVGTQLVYFAEVQLHASTFELGVFLASGGVGVIILSLAAGPLRRPGWTRGRASVECCRYPQLVMP